MVKIRNHKYKYLSFNRGQNEIGGEGVKHLAKARWP